MSVISVIGAGAWGTTVAKLIAQKGHRVRLWARRQETADEINRYHTNGRYLPDILLPSEIEATSELADMSADAVVIGIPSGYISVITDCHFLGSVPILCLTKGLLDNPGMPFISDYVADVCRNSSVAVLSGPNLAYEIALEKPALSVVASPQEDTTAFFQSLLNGPYFRVYASDDKRGVEVGGIFKNIIAIAAGVCDGLDIGSNAKAALISRGLIEMSRFGIGCGAKRPETFYGLSGLGDLVTTCHSTQSRNYQVGLSLARHQVLRTDNPAYVAEGVRSAKIIYEMGRQRNLDLPIVNEIYSMLHGNKSPTAAIHTLMTRTPKYE